MTVFGRYTGIVRDELSYASDMVRQWLGGADPGAGFYRSSMRRLDAVADTGALTSGVMTSVPIYLRKGDVVSNLTFRSGATAAVTPTNQWAALYSSAATPVLLGQSADATTTAWGATTNRTFALGAPVTITADGVYWVALMVKAATVPSLVGVSTTASAGITANERNLAQTSGSALASTAPATIATPTAAATVPLVILT
ncbi:hypothetical protein [Kitasatospora viridis]|uniref:Uncharacterized protein n=1 Tax=Kitasatospora viridis TaxID=281105 RepID=A0A561UKP5_9ACTN|nr:hypothetical protein [Kitasatospora viridis]TWF99916.1 hypothetical protein FHX73_113776 [Kitasatospora viridis]